MMHVEPSCDDYHTKSLAEMNFEVSWLVLLQNLLASDVDLCLICKHEKRRLQNILHQLSWLDLKQRHLDVTTTKHDVSFYMEPGLGLRFPEIHVSVLEST